MASLGIDKFIRPALYGAVAAIIVWVGLWTFDRITIRREVAKAEAEVVTFPVDGATPKHAVAWLERAGYEVLGLNSVAKEGHIATWSEFGGESGIAVVGRKPISVRRWRGNAYSVELEFMFRRDGTFLEVHTRSRWGPLAKAEE